MRIAIRVSLDIPASGTDGSGSGPSSSTLAGPAAVDTSNAYDAGRKLAKALVP